MRIIQVVDGIAIAELLQWHDASRSGEHRNAIDGTPDLQPSPGRVRRSVPTTVKEVIPFALRQPCFGATEAGGIVIIRDDRCHHQLRAETELIRDFICLRIIRVSPIHRLDKRHAFERRPVVHGVQVRQHHVTQPQSVHHGMPCFSGEIPWLFAHELRVAGMQTIDRAESAKLIPACFQMLVSIPAHMPADIVAPPSVADIRCRRGEIRLELQ